jgi:hypothetical protein
MSYSANIRQLPFCCGVYEAGNFNNSIDDHPYRYSDTVNDLLKELLEYAQGNPIIFNFYKKQDWNGDFYEEYEENELREAVRAHKHSMHLVEFVNKNSDNMVDTYIIKDYL